MTEILKFWKDVFWIVQIIDLKKQLTQMEIFKFSFHILTDIIGILKIINLSTTQYLMF